MEAFMEPDEVLDLRGVPCPANAARALIRLGSMDRGEILALLLDDGEPLDNVPRAVTEEGHAILGQERVGPGWRLLVRCS